MKNLFIFFSCILGTSAVAQVNAHAQVTSISGTTINVSNVNESFDTYETGELVIIMQMQDSVINAGAGNVASFGQIANIQSAGLYEVSTISSITESGSTPTAIILTSALGNTYNTCSNCRVQIISYPELGGGSDFTTSANINAVEWDGDIGGIIAFSVAGTLTVSHNISADGAGFRGAGVNAGGSAGCTATEYAVVTQANYADKGEGIFHATDATHAAGRAPIASGGGGGNSHNGGGGGGSNHSAGGVGGPGWPNCNPSAGGINGESLSANISEARIFMGGGGGAGEGNNGATNQGADGGGIVLIRATTLETTGACGSRQITADGLVGATAVQDGAGGAGAGGAVVLRVDNFVVVAGCPLNVTSDGGDGGDANHGAIHGGGGGGGHGTVIFSIAQPTTNISSSTDPGSGGANSTDASDGSANPGGGTVGGENGVIDQSNGPLPVTWLYAEAITEGDDALIGWGTVTETNNDYFVVERSANGRNWSELAKVSGQGNSIYENLYELYDFEPISGESFYRIKQVDFDGQYSYSEVVRLNVHQSGNSLTNSTTIYPNPVNNGESLKLNLNTANPVSLTILNLGGQIVYQSKEFSSYSNVTLDGWQAGVYLVQVDGISINQKLIVR